MSQQISVYISLLYSQIHRHPLQVSFYIKVMSQEMLKRICLFGASLCMHRWYVATNSWLHEYILFESFFDINDMSQKICVHMILFYINDMSQNIGLYIILFYRSLFMEKVLSKMVCRNKYVRMVFMLFFI